MDSSQVSHYSAAAHNVMEMRHDEVSAIQMNVSGKGGKKQPCEAAHGKETDKTQGIQHGSIVGNRAFIKRRGPVKNFYCGRDGYHEAKHGENQAGVNRLTGHEHVVSPDQEADDGDCEA